MRFDVAAVDGKLVGNGASGRHLLEDALPDATLRPPIVTVIDRCRRPIDGRNVAPSTARLQDMQDARDDRAVVDARLARPAARQVRLSAFHASSDSPNKLLAMTIASCDSNQAQIYNQNQQTVWVPHLARGTCGRAKL